MKRWLGQFLRYRLWRLRRFICCRIYKMDIASTVRIGTQVNLDKVHPQGIHIGAYTYITRGVTVLSHDHVRSAWQMHTHIGERCFIGCNAIILPGITIGDEVIIGAGSVVTKDIPAHSIAVGNPAKIIRTGITMTTGARLDTETSGKDAPVVAMSPSRSEKLC